KRGRCQAIRSPSARAAKNENPFDLGGTAARFAPNPTYLMTGRQAVEDRADYLQTGSGYCCFSQRRSEVEFTVSAADISDYKANVSVVADRGSALSKY